MKTTKINYEKVEEAIRTALLEMEGRDSGYIIVYSDGTTSSILFGNTHLVGKEDEVLVVKYWSLYDYEEWQPEDEGYTSKEGYAWNCTTKEWVPYDEAVEDTVDFYLADMVNDAIEDYEAEQELIA